MHDPLTLGVDRDAAAVTYIKHARYVSILNQEHGGRNGVLSIDKIPCSLAVTINCYRLISKGLFNKNGAAFTGMLKNLNKYNKKALPVNG